MKTVVWNVKGQLNSEYKLLSSEKEEKLIKEQLTSDPEIYGIKFLAGEKLPEEENGSLWLDNRRVG